MTNRAEGAASDQRRSSSARPDGPTADGRYHVINGRAWRASDPDIPDRLRQELVNELMSARRGVKDGQPDARTRVNDAKIALGERGQPWWEPPDSEHLQVRARSTMLALLRSRDGSTICPSDVARIIGGKDWRQQMELVRRVASDLVDEAAVVVLQKGEPVDARAARGPIRIALAKRTTTPN